MSRQSGGARSTAPFHRLLPLLALSILPALAVQVQAQDIKGGGFSGPGPAFVTVMQAKDMGDDARVSLKGQIIQSLGGEDYLFKDETGTISIEIDHKIWQGQQIGPADPVEIHGEVDKDWTRVEIDVKRVIKR